MAETELSEWISERERKAYEAYRTFLEHKISDLYGVVLPYMTYGEKERVQQILRIIKVETDMLIKKYGREEDIEKLEEYERKKMGETETEETITEKEYEKFKEMMQRYAKELGIEKKVKKEKGEE